MQKQGTRQDRRTLSPTSTKGIYRRSDGSYVVRFRDPQGKSRKRIARTLAEARAVQGEVRAAKRDGSYRQPSRQTFGEYAETWIDGYQGRTGRGIRSETVARYKRQLERDALPYLGRLRLGEIDPPTVKGYAKHLAGRGLSPSSVRLALAPVRACLADAFEDGLIRSNPAAGVRVASATPESAEPRAKALTEEELARLVRELPERWRPMILFLSESGLRIGEAVALRWSDVELDRGRVNVTRRWYAGGFAPPKSRFGVRVVPLAPGMVKTLAALKESFPDESAPVFVNLAGTMIDPSNVMARAFKPAARRAGVPWASWHTLRHTAATRWFRAGASPKQAQLLLGHHSPAFTLSVYVHLLPDDLPAADFLDELRWGHNGANRASETARNPRGVGQPRSTD